MKKTDILPQMTQMTQMGESEPVFYHLLRDLRHLRRINVFNHPSAMLCPRIREISVNQCNQR